MSVTIPTRKGLKAKAIASANPDLSISEVARLAGLERGAATKAMRQERFGRDKVKSRAQ